MAVHRELGPGWDEWDYHRALICLLEEKGMTVLSKPRKDLVHHGLVADTFEPDLIIENRIILELKHTQGKFAPGHYTQLISYLKFWEMALGLLMNFGLDKLQFQRIPYTPTSCAISLDGPWDRLNEYQAKEVRHVVEAAKAILHGYGLGYTDKTYRGLFGAECQRQGQSVTMPQVNLRFREMTLGEHEIDAMLLQSGIMVCITAFRESTRAVDMARLRSYMKHRDVPVGVLANFGKTQLQVRPVFHN